MTKQYLDKSGLTYFYGKIKDKLPAYQSYSISTNFDELDTGIYVVTANNLTVKYPYQIWDTDAYYSSYNTVNVSKGDIITIQRAGSPITIPPIGGTSVRHIYVGDFFEINGSINVTYKLTNIDDLDDPGVGIQYTCTWKTNDTVITKTSELTNNSGFITSSDLPDMSNYLAKNNTTAFTPTGDYQPATKKYVDDNAGGGGSTYTAGDGINITNNVISSVIPVAPYTTKSNPFGAIQEYYISFDQLKTGIYRAVRDTSKTIYLRLPINRNGSGSYTYKNVTLTTDSILIVDNTAYNAYSTVGYLAANSTITVIDGRVIHTYCLSNVFVDSPTGSATANNNTWSESYTTDYVDNTRTLATDYWYNQLDPNSNVHVYTVSATIGTLTVAPGDMIIGNPKKSITGHATSPKLYSYSTNKIYTFSVTASGNTNVLSTVDWIPSTDVYSTSETLTNKVWIDGSPIYRKVYKLTGTYSAGDSSTISLSDLNINRIVDMKGNMYSSSFGYIDMYFYNGSNYNYIHTNGLSNIQWRIGFDASEIYIIIEYTKSS